MGQICSQIKMEVIEMCGKISDFHFMIRLNGFP